MNPKPKRHRTEDKHQIAYFSWLRLQHPEIAKVTIHIPNEGKRNQIHGWKMGITSGFPDIFMFLPSHMQGVLYHGLAIEMKRPGEIKKAKGELTENQCIVIARLRQNGYKCEVCYGWIEAKQMTEIYLES